MRTKQCSPCLGSGCETFTFQPAKSADNGFPHGGKRREAATRRRVLPLEVEDRFKTVLSTFGDHKSSPTKKACVLLEPRAHA